jgi:hypothetical protein
MGTGDSSPNIQQPGHEADHSSLLCWGYKYAELHVHSCVFTVWCLVKHRIHLQGMYINFYNPDLISYLQGQVLQYIASQCLHLCSTVGDMCGLSKIHHKHVNDVKKRLSSIWMHVIANTWQLFPPPATKGTQYSLHINFQHFLHSTVTLITRNIYLPHEPAIGWGAMMCAGIFYHF